jgi:hypothetical protein
MLSITGSAWAGLAAPHQQLASFRLRRDCERDSIMVAPAQQWRERRMLMCEQVAIDDHCTLWLVSILPLYETIMCDVHRTFRVDKRRYDIL